MWIFSADPADCPTDGPAPYLGTLNVRILHSYCTATGGDLPAAPSKFRLWSGLHVRLTSPRVRTFYTSAGCSRKIYWTDLIMLLGNVQFDGGTLVNYTIPCPNNANGTPGFIYNVTIIPQPTIPPALDGSDNHQVVLNLLSGIHLFDYAVFGTTDEVNTFLQQIPDPSPAVSISTISLGPSATVTLSSSVSATLAPATSSTGAPDTSGQGSGRYVQNSCIDSTFD